MRTVMFAAAAAGLVFAGGASAQVTPEMKAKIAAIGDVVDPPSTALLYRPLHPSLPYPGVTVVRDQKYGPDPRNILDVFTPTTGPGNRPVLIFVPGGAGNKIEPVPGGDAFYDNVMLWAAKHGMTGVNMQRRAGGAWDATARDVSAAIQWTKANIAKHGGDPDRIFIWGHSAGAMSLANYLAHPETWGPGGVGVKGAVLMAGPYNVDPIPVKAPELVLRMGMTGERVPMRIPPPTPESIEHAIFPGLAKVNIPLFVSVAEIDPPYLVELANIVRRELTAAGKPPTFLVYKDHGHASEIYAVGTDDISTSQPVLEWMKAIK